jgi:hypothetical protein
MFIKKESRMTRIQVTVPQGLKEAIEEQMRSEVESGTSYHWSFSGMVRELLITGLKNRQEGV